MKSKNTHSWFTLLERIDRRIIYLFVACSLAIPISMDVVLPPAPLRAADQFFESVNELKKEEGKMVLIAADWGPSTKAENKLQTFLAIEHLMRKRIPFALISITAQATPFLRETPLEVAEKLNREYPDQEWRYGEDWVNFGFQPGGIPMIQGIARTSDLKNELKTDDSGTPLSDLPAMDGVETIRDIQMLMEFTGLVGAFNYWLQFFQIENYAPQFVHGCTSISIPEAHIYLASKQITGLLEGAAGAAWYDTRLGQKYPGREPSKAPNVNTGLSVAQLLVIAFIILGNVGYGLSLLESHD